jgi:hypothetical protein
VYSLISAPVLGFDLTRLAGGAATAELLEVMLAVPVEGWAATARLVPPESARLTAARAAARIAAGTRPTIRDLRPDDPTRAVGLLRAAPIGTLTGLLHCVRTDVLVADRDRPGIMPTPAPAAVADAAVDAVTATYLRELLTDDDRRTLAARWLTTRRHLPVVPVDLGPQQVAVERLLTAVSSLSVRGGGRALVEAADAVRARGWAAAMHSLTWAVHLSGRIRTAATVQFRLVQAVDLAGIPVADRAGGVWNLLSGAAQALVVRDLADADSAAALLSPAVPALGVDWLFDS